MRKRSGCLARGASAALIAATSLSWPPALADASDRTIARRIELAFGAFIGDRAPMLRETASDGPLLLLDRVALKLTEPADPKVPEARATSAGPVVLPVGFNEVATAYDIMPRLAPEARATLRTAADVAILQDAVQPAPALNLAPEMPFVQDKPVAADDPAERPPSRARKLRAAPPVKRIIQPVSATRRPKAPESPQAASAKTRPAPARSIRPAAVRPAAAPEAPAIAGHARSFSPKMSAAGPAQTISR